MRPRPFLTASALAATLLLGAAASHAATVEVEGDVATAIRNLQIGGLTYDVTFPVGSSASTYGNPPKFDAKSSSQAKSAVKAVIGVLNSEGGVLGVGVSSSNGRPIFRVAFGVEDVRVPPTDIIVEYLSVWEGVTGDAKRPGKWGHPTDPDVFPFGDDGAFAKFEQVGSGGGQGNSAPAADAGGPYSGAIGVAVKFDGSGSSDPDGEIVMYDWNFGDGGTSTKKSPKHAYSSNGNYNVRLTVTDDSGKPSSDGTSARIGEGGDPPVADAGGPYGGSPGTAVKFNGGGSSDPNGKIKKWEWDFGDGTKKKTGKKPKHTYEESGRYSVTLEVTNEVGDTDKDTTDADIGEGNLPPVADAGGPYDASAGSRVKFNGKGSEDPGGKIRDYDWDFGDGSSGKGKKPKHEYDSPGDYTVTLTVTDNDGVRDSDSTTAVIK